MADKKATLPVADIAGIANREGQAAAAAAAGITQQRVSRMLKTYRPSDSLEELRKQKVRREKAMAGLAEKRLAQVSGELVLKERVNAVILAHARRYKLAMLHLKEIDGDHGTATAKILEDAFRGFGAEIENTLKG